MNGLDIIRRVYARLRNPSQQALPWQTVRDAVRDAVALKRLDLALETHSSEGVVSDWFTAPSTDFLLSDVQLTGILLPTRLERRYAQDTTTLVGAEVPSVDYGIFSTAPAGRSSFYGDPLRLALNDSADYVAGQQYRLVYEPDFPSSFTTSTDAQMPNYFMGLVSLEAAYDVLDMVEDDSQEWMAFVDRMERKWPLEIVDRRRGWEQYARVFRGRAQVPKRTIWDNMRRPLRTRWFKG